MKQHVCNVEGCMEGYQEGKEPVAHSCLCRKLLEEQPVIHPYEDKGLRQQRIVPELESSQLQIHHVHLSCSSDYEDI